MVSNIYIRHIESNTTVFYVLLPNLDTEHSADDFDFGILCSLCVFFECVISASFSICALMHTESLSHNHKLCALNSFHRLFRCASIFVQRDIFIEPAHTQPKNGR